MEKVAVEVDVEARVREILATVRPLAAEFYRLTGKPLGVTGEVAEYIAAERLGLTLAPARTVGYDALRGSERIQIKGRAYGENAKPGQRCRASKQTLPATSCFLSCWIMPRWNLVKCGKLLLPL